MKEPLIVLTGPTAVGKTKASITLAKRIGGEIISADSMQVYRHMDIGSAKIRPEEMGGVPHYLVDVLEPDQEFNVVRFQSMAREAVEKIRANGHIPSWWAEQGFISRRSSTILILQREGRTMSCAGSWRPLPGRRGRPHSTPAGRGGRGVCKGHPPEQCEAGDPGSGILSPDRGKISEHNERERQRSSPYDFRYFVLNDERSRLYGRIDRRVDQMMEEGLVEEVRR